MSACFRLITSILSFVTGTPGEVSGRDRSTLLHYVSKKSAANMSRLYHVVHHVMLTAHSAAGSVRCRPCKNKICGRKNLKGAFSRWYKLAICTLSSAHNDLIAHFNLEIAPVPVRSAFEHNYFLMCIRSLPRAHTYPSSYLLVACLMSYSSR